jgi:hypothetical protein
VKEAITANESHSREKHGKFGHTVRALRRVIRTGALEGVLLSVILTAWLLVANRLPFFDRFALLRNAIAIASLGLAALVPVVRFRNSAKDILPAGAIGLGIGCLCYSAWTIYFDRLTDRMGVFQIFVMGLIVYTLAAVVFWVVSMIRSARHHHHMAVHQIPRPPAH